MTTQICALPTCDSLVGDKPFKLGLYPGEYCCRECVNDAFTLKKSGQPFSKVSDIPPDSSVKEVKSKRVPHIAASDFGDVGVIRHFCDNSVCTNPGRNPVIEIDGTLHTIITLCWKGRFGEYCSNECLKTEKEKKMSDENDSPVSAGDPAPKKKGATKKAAKKSAPAVKKATKKTAPATKKATAKASTPRDGSIMEKVLALLKRKSGTTHEEVMELTGWNKHTTQSMFSPTTMTVKHGVKVIGEKVGDTRRYYIR